MRPTEDVSRETRQRLDIYVDLLTRWNARIRLTGLDFRGVTDPVADSLQLRSLLPEPPARALDIGSGNGLPALPLSIAYGIPYVLVESDQRKAAFLREVAREAACPVTVAACRIEHMPIETYDLITSRAFARLSRLLAIAWPRQAAGTVCLFPKGSAAAAELQEARQDWQFRALLHPQGAGQVIEVASIEPARA